MRKAGKQPPKQAAVAAPERAVREQRLAAALRENLRRRKEQARDRQTDPAPESSSPGSGERRDS